MESLKQLTDEVNALTSQNRVLLAKADQEQGGVLTADQEIEYENRDKAIDEKLGTIERFKKQNSRHERLQKLENLKSEPIGRITDTSNLSVSLGKDNKTEPFKLTIRGQELSFDPGTNEHLRGQPSYSRSFTEYLRTGNPSGLMTTEQLGLQVGDNSRGGYLAPMTFIAKLVKFMDDLVYMRQLATVYSGVSPTGMGAPSYDTDPGDADWTAEVLTTDMSEDDTARFGKRELIPKDLSKMILVSRKIFKANPFMDIESFMASRLAYKFAISEEKAFLTGTGGKQPLGVFVADSNGISTSRDTTCASQTVFTFDEVIDCFYSLKVQYQANATWLVSREFLKRLRKLKSSTAGEYLWTPPGNGNPALIMERPYKVSEYVPSTYTTGLYVAMVGDFRAGYWIADGFDFSIQRLEELYATKKQIAFIGEKSTDGMPVLEEAFQRLKLA